MPNSSHFGSRLINGLEKKISSEGYNLSIHIIRQAEIDALILPNNFELKHVDGIVCIELFDKAYTELINNLGIPTIFIDSKLNAKHKLPSAFVCVNDFVAIGLIKALKSKNIKVPEDVLVTGFDDSPESSIIDPHLTTVHIYSTEMGTIAADLILSRLRHPSRPVQITHVKTKPIFRESTGNII